MTTTQVVRRYGWKRDNPRQDRIYAAPQEILTNLPASVDLRPLCPPVYDQLNLGACTSNAIAGMMEFLQIKLHLTEETPSRLMLYYGEREKEGTIPTDSGARISDGIAYVVAKGVCPESMWVYDPAKFAVKPTQACYQAALQHKALSRQRILRNLSQMKACLASGYPWVYGFTVYASFESQQVADTGIVPMPDQFNEQELGGHAVMACGYDDVKQVFYTRNSWGVSWALQGYFEMPYQYLLDGTLSADFWTIQKEE